VEILSRSTIDTVIQGKNQFIELNQHFLITAFDSGFYAIPPVLFAYKMPGDTSIFHIETDPILLSVYTVDVDTTMAIKPIKAPLKVPITFMEILPYLIIYVLLGILIPGWYYFRKRKKTPEGIIIRKPKVPPHITALESLKRLKREKLWQSGKIKEYHSLLTEIVRIYIEDRFHIPAIEMTTPEILDGISKLSLRDELVIELSNILELADLVKFAKAQPLPDEHAECMDKAVDFVEQTLPEIATLESNQDAEGEGRILSENEQIERKL
jgi:hypothetical protein